MSRFPKLTETFILDELLALQARGMSPLVYPLVHQRGEPRHGALDRLQAVVRGPPSAVVLAAAWCYWARQNPRGLRRLCADIWDSHWKSPRFLLRAVRVVPLAAWMARDMQAAGVRHLHAHWATHPALTAFCVHRLTGISYSLTAHAHDLFAHNAMLDTKLRHAAFIATISEYNRTHIGQRFGPETLARVAVVRCGVSLTEFSPERRRPALTPPSIVCVGSLEPKKGHRHLLDACMRLCDAGVSFHCICVGGGPLRAALQRQALHVGVGDRVTFTGPLPRERVIELLATASVVVQPSVVTSTGKMEGIPVSLMEALAMELPVVASAISGIPELIQHDVTGLLVPPADPEALAAAIRRLLADRDLAQRLGAAGRRHVAAHYALDRNAADLQARFERCLGAVPASGGAS